MVNAVALAEDTGHSNPLRLPLIMRQIVRFGSQSAIPCRHKHSDADEQANQGGANGYRQQASPGNRMLLHCAFRECNERPSMYDPMDITNAEAAWGVNLSGLSRKATRAPPFYSVA